MKVAFITLGCKVNQYETQAIAELFIEAGHTRVEFDDAADAYIINTCTVTHISDRKSRQLISRARETSKNAVIAVIGCYTQRAPEEISAIEGVSLIFGTKDRANIVPAVESLFERSDVQPTVKNITTYKNADEFDDISAISSEKTRAFLKIQDGCNRYCSYCIIPYTRGNIRSRSLLSIQNELNKLAANGFKEIVLTGIHLMSYGLDLKEETTGISDALLLAENTGGIERVRLGSLEPKLLTKGMIDVFAGSSKLCRQFHLSLQSGSDAVLKRMNRTYTAKEYAECVEMLREKMPDCAITTDIIAGFPAETENEHRETLSFAESIGFSKTHVFPFSKRSGTAAAKMPDQIDPAVKKRRAKELSLLGDKSESEYLTAQVGTVQSVLFEESANGFTVGHTKTYLFTKVKKNDQLCGKIFDVKIIDADGKSLYAEV